MNRVVALYKLNEFRQESLDKDALVLLYPKFKNYFTAQGEENIFNIFAVPKVQQIENTYEIAWNIDSASEPKSIRDLEPSIQNHYQSILEGQLSYFKSLIQKWRHGTENQKIWATTLSRLINIPDESFIYCADNQIFLICWGASHLAKNDLSGFNKSVAGTQTNIGIENTEETTYFEDINISERAIYHPEDESNKFETNIQETTSRDSISENQPSDSPNEKEYIRSDASTNEIKVDITKKPWWRKNLLFLILGLILLVLLLAFGLNKCNSDKGIQLPSDGPNIHVPINEDDLIHSEDSTTTIVSNRINILIKDQSVDINKFVEDLNIVFEKEKIQIIYFDTTMNRMQLQVPKDKREEIKERLKKELPQYDLLIWDEFMMKSSLYIPNDPLLDDDENSWQFDVTEAYAGWSITRGSSDVKVAIIDAGFDIRHDEFKGKNIETYNIINRTNDVFAQQQEGRDHGTHVATISAGVMGNLKGSTGIAPKSDLLLIKVADDRGLIGTNYVIDAVLYAIYNDADVVNLSLGMSFNFHIDLPLNVQYFMINNMFKDVEDVWNQVFEIANERNCTIVMATGNDHMLTGLDPMQRNSSTIKVTAVDPNLNITDFSNFGHLSTIAAPGFEILSAVSGNRYAKMSGTSMASPIVTGAVALIKSIQPDIANMAIVELLLHTGLPIKDQDKSGPLLQIAKALEFLKNGGIDDDPSSNFDCDNIQAEIDSLQQRIDELRGRCRNQTPPDTLKMPKNPKNTDFLEGLWMSTTKIFNDRGEKVIVYFEFERNGNHKIHLKEKSGLTCTGDLNVTVKSSQLLFIDQTTEAYCTDKNSYQPYRFDFVPDQQGKVNCKAYNKLVRSNIFTFNLIRVQ